MGICINQKCSQPGSIRDRQCKSCGSDTVLNGRYDALRLLSNNSGFGIIYEVFEGQTPKILKVLDPDHNQKPKIIELFKQEADLLARLDNPGIPTTKGDGYFEYSTSNGDILHCLVMEKIEGINLQEWRKTNTLSDSQGIKWLKEIAKILDEVHDQQLFHRDIKPQNIMKRANDTLVLIDFGTARENSRTYLAESNPTSITEIFLSPQSKSNKTGITGIYSSGYTPPEQIKGKAVPQSDFFALGRTFVYLLTGKQPKNLHNAYNDTLNWRPDACHCHPIFLDFIDRLMAREVKDRPQNTKALLREIEEVEKKLATNPIPPKPPEPGDKTTATDPKLPQALIDLGNFAAVAKEKIVNQWGKNGDTPQPTEPKPPKPGDKTTVTDPKLPQALIDLENLTAVAGEMIVKLKWGENGNTPQPTDFTFTTASTDAEGNISYLQQTRRQFIETRLPNGVKLEMVEVPGGTFTMGTPDNEHSHCSNEGPQHQVTVPTFYMGKYPVTQAQWQAVMGNNPSHFKGENRPVEKVSWFDAVNFCQKLANLTGLGYRLPTEAQWEYACRAGTTKPFSFGETITTELANYNGSQPSVLNPKVGVYRQETTDVGSFPANDFGLYDLHGNVWEWCKDVYHDSYNGKPERLKQDGSRDWLEFNILKQHNRVLRGGSWYETVHYCPSGYRKYRSPDSKDDSNIGFRVILRMG